MNDREELSCFKSSSQLMAGVLVAISIPIFTGQLKKARLATDAANLRAAYATASAKVLETEKGVSAGPVAMHQADEGFKTDVKDATIGGIKLDTLTTAKSGVTYYVNVGTNGEVTIDTKATGGYTTVNPITGA